MGGIARYPGATGAVGAGSELMNSRECVARLYGEGHVASRFYNGLMESHDHIALSNEEMGIAYGKAPGPKNVLSRLGRGWTVRPGSIPGDEAVFVRSISAHEALQAVENWLVDIAHKLKLAGE